MGEPERLAIGRMAWFVPTKVALIVLSVNARTGAPHSGKLDTPAARYTRRSASSTRWHGALRRTSCNSASNYAN